MSASPALDESPPAASLPTPAERPGADVVIYDGQCRLCQSQMKRLARWDRQGKLAYLSLDDPETRRRYPQWPREALAREMHVVDARGNCHRGADAVRYLSRRLRTLWWLVPLLHIPLSRPLWRWLYRRVAKHRYRFGKVHTCHDGTCGTAGHDRPAQSGGGT